MNSTYYFLFLGVWIWIASRTKQKTKNQKTPTTPKTITTKKTKQKPRNQKDPTIIFLFISVTIQWMWNTCNYVYKTMWGYKEYMFCRWVNRLD